MIDVPGMDRIRIAIAVAALTVLTVGASALTGSTGGEAGAATLPRAAGASFNFRQYGPDPDG